MNTASLDLRYQAIVNGGGGGGVLMGLLSG